MVISCKIVNSSIMFKLINKISINHEKFLALLNLLRGPDVKPSEAGSGSRAAGCASLDYCNSVDAGLPKTCIRQRQSTFNSATRMAADQPKSWHFSGYIRETLRWLPIEVGITFKIDPLERANTSPEASNTCKA